MNRTIQITQHGKQTTVVHGTCGAGKNAWLMGMMCHYGLESCGMVAVESNPSMVALKVPTALVAPTDSFSIESILRSLVNLLQQPHIKMVAVEYLIAEPHGSTLKMQLDAIDIIARAYNKPVFVGVPLARNLERMV